ncbi:MAG: hypothetical protein EAZ32_06065 [Cytophagia bacterium]|nr:MAG: hypothetical protein EAZ38_04675 [Cytophagales bacterium]TAG40597.1 MAG: hypothetical protein EAZ32_06065 [Cytophagia bacterium]TAG83641.1 MAG: hypothetical protein EAZ22_02250 [Cytophagales bacterium]
MKINAFTLFFSLLLAGQLAYSQSADTLSFARGGGVLYQGKAYLKPAQIAPILLKNQDPQIALHFEKYKANRGAGAVFGFVGGLGIGYPLGGLIAGREFQTGLFAGGLGVAAIGLLLNGSANKSLKEAIGLYNGKVSPPKVSFAPLFYQQNQISHLGLVVKF